MDQDGSVHGVGDLLDLPTLTPLSEETPNRGVFCPLRDSNPNRHIIILLLYCPDICPIRHRPCLIKGLAGDLHVSLPE